jgi:hypothetical protein
MTQQMCRWLVYIGEKILLSDILITPQHSLLNQSLPNRALNTPDVKCSDYYNEKEHKKRNHNVCPVEVYFNVFFFFISILFLSLCFASGNSLDEWRRLWRGVVHAHQTLRTRTLLQVYAE